MTPRQRRWPGVSRVIFTTVLSTMLALVGLVTAAGVAMATPYASLIMDARTGDILDQSNANARLHPASLTKMMTLYIAFEALENGEIDPDTRVRISRHAASQPPSRLGLRAGQRIAFRYLIRAAALRSANDAAVAIGEALEGTVANFAARMNRTARAIGMTRTHFVNPNGLTAEGHLSTAHDMAILGRQLYFDYPDYYGIFSRLSDNAGMATVRNTNRRFLRGYRGADGIKTGYTSAAGYNLAAMAERGGVRILVVVMGARSSSDRMRRVTRLMDRGFRLAPRRASIRRPPRPDYVRGADDTGSGPAAGRVIRLQTAPQASRFPRARPDPNAPPAPDTLIAGLQSDIDAVIADIRDPDPSTDTQETAYPPGMTSQEPESPGDDAQDVALDAAPDPGGDPGGDPAGDPAQDPLNLMADSGSGSGDSVRAPGAGSELALDASPVPVRRPDSVGDLSVTRAGVSPQDGLLMNPPPGEPVHAEATQPASAAATPRQFEHDAHAIAAVVEENGRVAIPGLPAIITGPATIHAGPPAAAGADPATDPGPTASVSGQHPEASVAQPSQAPPEPAVQPDPNLQPERAPLVVDAEGRIRWRDEELLAALSHERPEDPVLAPTIVLTTRASEDTPPPPMPEIVTRVSTGGGRVFAVELGEYASRFDAERVLLRLALSESATLGNGIRRVTPKRGKFVAEIRNLSQEEAETACLRLVARDHPCTVIEP